MAMARATCTCATCGKTFEVSVSRRNRKEADSFVVWAEKNITECPECEEARVKAMREEAAKEAAAEAAQLGWPVLAGTEKQVAWADRIRKDSHDGFIRQIESRAKRLTDDQIHQLEKEFEDKYAVLVAQKTKASWWIENRIRLDSHMIKILAEAEAAQQEAEVQPEPQAEETVPATAEPVEKKHEGAVRVTADEKAVSAVYSRNDDFRSIVKGLGYIWDGGVWALSLSEKTGSAEERIAELGNKLLNAGFAVVFDNAGLMNRAIRGEYEPMCRRWIQSHSDGFYVLWSKEDDLYHQAKSLPGARYSSPGVIVPERSWDAVADYAEKYGYRYTAKAQEKMDRLSGKAVVAEPAPARDPEYAEHDVLQSSREVLNDLRDED